MSELQKLKRLWKDRDNQKQYIKWLGRYSKPFIGRITMVMILGILASGIGLSMAWVTKRIIDIADGTVKAAPNRILMFIGVYLGMILLTEVINVALTLLRTMLNERFSFGIRKQVYEKILASSFLGVQKYHTGDLMTRLTSDAGTIADGIVTTIPGLITLMVELLMVFCMLFYYSPMLAIFALLIAPVAAGMAWWLGRKLKKLQLKVQESEASYRSFLQESIANLLIMKAFSNEQYAADRLTTLREERFFWVFKKTKYSVISSTIMALSFQLGYIVALSYGAMQIAAGEISFGTMSVFLTLVGRVQSPIMQLAQQIPKVISILASTERVIEIQSIESELYDNERPVLEGKVGVDIEDLCFGYTDEQILKNVNMHVNPGDTVAIVGESGIGKTTLIRLVMSFLKPDQGKITFYNDKGEKEETDASSRRFIAYVPQGNTLFSGTIRENIRMGRLDATEEEMMEALEQTAALSFIKNLPMGLDTVIGEKGHGLSEGQAQRIAIARALVKKAPFLILDEATSALDEETELRVLKGLQKMNPRPTCLVITHRMSVLKYCDREVKIENRAVNDIIPDQE